MLAYEKFTASQQLIRNTYLKIACALVKPGPEVLFDVRVKVGEGDGAVGSGLCCQRKLESCGLMDGVMFCIFNFFVCVDDYSRYVKQANTTKLVGHKKKMRHLQSVNTGSPVWARVCLKVFVQ